MIYQLLHMHAYTHTGYITCWYSMQHRIWPFVHNCIFLLSNC